MNRRAERVQLQDRDGPTQKPLGRYVSVRGYQVGETVCLPPSLRSLAETKPLP